jgi:hypothetical protein
VASLIDHQWLAPGPHEFAFEAASLSAGCYFARLEAGHRVGTTRVLVVR